MRNLLAIPFRTCGRRASLLLLGLLLVLPVGAEARDRLIVAAASSLTEVIGELSAAFEERHPEVRVLPSFAGSGVHRVQIERGAPIDVLVFASPTQVEPLIELGKVRPGAAVVVAANQLVLVAKRGTAFTNLEELEGLDRLLVAAGDPIRVPAGEYAARLFGARHWDPGSLGRLVPADNVRQVLRYVEAGVVAAGFVYRTDALGSHSVVLLESYGPDEVGEIEVVAAPLERTDLPSEAREFVRFLGSEDTAEIWAAHGFLRPGNRDGGAAPGPRTGTPGTGSGPEGHP